MSTFITAGNSSELLSKHDRQNCCLPEFIEAFSSFEPPELSHYRCYYKKFPQYSNENTPFYQYVPSEDELELDRQECEKAEEEKARLKVIAAEKRAERKRLEEEVAEVGEDGVEEVVEEVPEEVAEEAEEVAEEAEVAEDEAVEEIFELVANAEEILGNDDLDDLFEDLNGVHPAIDDIISGIRTRSGRLSRPSAKLRDQYS